MTQIQESPPFPNHQFDFADVVFVLPLQENGLVVGILYRDPHWYYQLALASPDDNWWHESQLAFAMPDGCPTEESILVSDADESITNNLR